MALWNRSEVSTATRTGPSIPCTLKPLSMCWTVSKRNRSKASRRRRATLTLSGGGAATRRRTTLRRRARHRANEENRNRSLYQRPQHLRRTGPAGRRRTLPQSPNRRRTPPLDQRGQAHAGEGRRATSACQPEVPRLFKGNFREYSAGRLSGFLTAFD